MRLRDDDGNWVTAGDRVRFNYGIPPVCVRCKVVERRGTLWVLTPGHTPSECPLRALRWYVGGWFKQEVEE